MIQKNENALQIIFFIDKIKYILFNGLAIVKM